MSDFIGKKVRIQLLRNYGPYLDNRPWLRAGEYDAIIDAVSHADDGSPRIGGLYIEHGAFRYPLELRDTKVIPNYRPEPERRAEYL